jgi:hypothetical protein
MMGYSLDFPSILKMVANDTKRLLTSTGMDMVISKKIELFIIPAGHVVA